MENNKKERVLCAAIWYKTLPLARPVVLESRNSRPKNVDQGVVICGWRHANCISQVAAITGLRSVPSEAGESVQGFLTNLNRFVDREEAAQIAFDAGQIVQHTISLFSEDLY